jgi:hypothetical protein
LGSQAWENFTILDRIGVTEYNGYMRDLRRYARQTNVRLVVGFILALFLVGDGLIYAFWGLEAALMGLVCILAGFIPLALTVLALWGIEWIVRKNNGDGR